MQSTDVLSSHSSNEQRAKLDVMDELTTQLGLAVSNLSASLPRYEFWSGPAAQALALEIDALATEVGSLILDLAVEPLERLLVG